MDDAKRELVRAWLMAAQAAVAEMMALAAEDFEWARPHIEEADASLARGEGIPGAQFLERLDRRLNALR